MTTFHVRYEILDDPRRSDPDADPDGFRWGVRAVGLPGDASVYGVGDTLDDALSDLVDGLQTVIGAGPVPDELTREVAVTIEDAA
jgi:hypothetical protein